MEEWVGKVWHRFITRAANRECLDAAVTLEDVRVQVAVLFRALGGDGGLKVDTATATEHGARRRWLERIAGTGADAELAWRDEQTLRLPGRIAVFPTRQLNRDLYLWLAALAAAEDRVAIKHDWLFDNQRRTVAVLHDFPGLKPVYQRLLTAQLALRPLPEKLNKDERAQELAIQQALTQPGSVIVTLATCRPPQPVHLWLHPSPQSPVSRASAEAGDEQDEDSQEGESRDARQRKHRAQREDMPDGRDGLLAMRFENLLTAAEYVKVDRTAEEDELDSAEQAADDMDQISVARDGRSLASRLRLDLDLPAADFDDIFLGEGIPLPEWDWRNQRMQPDYVRLQPMIARDALAQPLPDHLRPVAKRLRRQFATLAQQRTWLRAQSDGCELDLTAYLDYQTQRKGGVVGDNPGVYRDLRLNQRDLACLLLADLSLSTDAYVNDHARVIDVIRDSLQLFSGALSASNDRYAIYGFSSRRRSHVRFHTLKEFGESYGAEVCGRIQAIKPGYYTRMGAAIRHASDLLAKQAASRQLLLILTDGKPNDLDQYEGRYGVEDTRMALLDARKRGLFPFCVTIDKEAGSYLPHLFGAGNYMVICRPDELPKRLPALYARLTA